MTTLTHEHTAVERYVQFWNAETPALSSRLAALVFTEDVDYRALIGVQTGRKALIEFLTDFRARVGPVSFVAREEPQIHHGRARLAWEIRTATGGSFATGTDVIAFTDDGRIGSVAVFLDRAPEGFDPDAHH